MQTLPRTIVNPLINDRVTFLKTAAETGGAYTLVEVLLMPGGGTGIHYHLDFTEEFEAVEGVLGVQLGKTEHRLQPGEKAQAPVRAVHRFYNPGKTPIRFRVTIRPARRFEDMLRISYGLARDGRTNAKGMPKSIWHLALLFEIGETYLPGLPLRLQKGIFGWLAKGARKRGRDKELEGYYTGRIDAPVREEAGTA